MEIEKPKSPSMGSRTNRDAQRAKSALLDQLLAEHEDGKDLFGPEGVFTKLKGAVMERLLEGELATHLEQGSESNARNGHTSKEVQTETGPVRIRVPRDRDGTFEPQVVKKHQRRVEGFDEKVIALYARGMSTRDIQGHLRELYGTDVSHELISKATEGVMEEFRAWQSRPLEPFYAMMYLDALFVSVRDGSHIQKRAFYVAMGVTQDGHRDVLGLWAAQSEGAKFWLTILTELKQRGIEDVLFVCADGLIGLDKAFEAAFPKTVYQTCVVHLIRSALRFVSWADRKDLASHLRSVYNASNEEEAKLALSKLDETYGKKFPGIAKVFRNRWENFVPFLAYPNEIRRVIYTTNVIESLNAQLRKALKARGPFPNDEAVFKLFFLAIRNAKLHWNKDKNWVRVLNQLDIFFENRIPT